MTRSLLLASLFAASGAYVAAAPTDSLATAAPAQHALAAQPETRDAAQGTSLLALAKKVDLSLKFGGYIVAKYATSDERGKASDGGFDLRFVRLYLNGYCFNDFYYRLQMEVNGAPGPDKGPRVVDAFVEWQRYDFARIKLGQFKRSFGFENPYSPLTVGHGAYSQATMKLASIGDRCGEHKSSGRDLGVQIQGDLLPARGDGHKWLHYQVGVFNGQGINHSDADHQKDLIGGLWLAPLKDLCIGGFGWSGSYRNEAYKDGDARQQLSVKRVRWGAGLKYESAWTVRGEYMSSVGGVTTNVALPRRSDGWYATVGVPCTQKLKVYGRWDCYRDAKTWASLRTNWGLSGNYTLGKNLIFQANYTRTFARDAAIDRRFNAFDVQVYARF